MCYMMRIILKTCLEYIKPPTFRSTVNQILRNANSNIRISTEESVDEMRSRFASPATELSSLSQQGGSSSNNSATPVIQKATARSEVSPRLSLVSPNENINRTHLFQRGTNYQQRYSPYQNMSSRRSRVQNSPSSSKISGLSVRAIFKTKDVVLLPTSTESDVLRGERKTLLMSHGFIRNKLEIEKSC